MKTSIYIAVLVFFTLSFLSTQKAVASGKTTIVTDTIHIEGNCNQCKERIENAALIKGVKKADYNKQAHQLVVTYDSDKISNDEIQKAVAAIGHDTPKYKADDKVYEKLPACCHYREEGAHIH